MEARHGVCFVSLKSDLCSGFVIAMLTSMLCYIKQYHNGMTRNFTCNLKWRNIYCIYVTFWAVVYHICLIYTYIWHKNQITKHLQMEVFMPYNNGSYRVIHSVIHIYPSLLSSHLLYIDIMCKYNDSLQLDVAIYTNVIQFRRALFGA